MKTNDIPKEASENGVIFDSYVKAKSVLEKHENAMCSISGGADSDIVMDIIARLDADHCVDYVWYNTGLEYKATKDHLDYLEDRYGVKIKREKALKSVPTCCKEYGQPFISKFISDMLSRLQRHNFQWEIDSTDVLMKRYDRCKNPIYWWNNENGKDIVNGRQINVNRFNIALHEYLKEYMISNPPQFQISSTCCEWSKKKTAKHVQQEYDLAIVGVRKAEGGIRSTTYKNCYEFSKTYNVQYYRPIFWYTNKDKDDYKRLFDIKNSDCYEVWGFTRTGCVGCPFSKYLERDLAIVQQYEPQLYKACNNAFKDSYEYTRKYHEFRDDMKEREKYKTIK